MHGLQSVGMQAVKVKDVAMKIPVQFVKFALHDLKRAVSTHKIIGLVF